MRAYLILCALALLAGCATPTPLGGDARVSGGGPYAVATLAPWGSFEFQAAPGYTRLAIARRSAVRRLQTGRMSVDQAQALQDAADRARSALDDSVVEAGRGDTQLAEGRLREAMKLIESAEAMLQR